MSCKNVCKTSSRHLQDIFIRLDEDVLKTSFAFVFRGRLQGVFKTYSRCLAKTSSSCSQKAFKASCKNVFKTSSRRLQYVFKLSGQNVLKTSSKRLQDVLQKRLHEIFKTSPRRFKDAFKTFSRYLQGVLQGCFEDFFKTYYQVKMFLLTSLQDVFNTFLRRSAKRIIYRRICLGHTSEKFVGSVQNLQDR